MSSSASTAAPEIDPYGEIQQKVTYSPPSWQLPIPEELDYQLEVINNGSIQRHIILRNVLKNGSYATIGKPEMSTIIEKHPSVSRVHAALQFGLLGNKYGWFLYDNGSTHGTKLNRAKLPPKYYAKLAIGATFTLGASKQLYCLTGPSHEEEEEYAKKAFAKAASSSSSTATSNTPSVSEAKAFAADPIGWLTGYYETEGLQVEYSFTPGGGQNTVCSIDLRMVLESAEDTVVKGEGRGRDEAKKNAALAACQRIDAQQSLGYDKSDFRTKRQEYEENDYYSSEEDEYLDRTGQLAERRKKRQQRYNDPETANKALTHEELVKQLAEAETSLENVKKYQEQISEEARKTKSLSAKFLLSTSRQKLLVAQSEVRKLTALVEATKPADVDKAFEKAAEAERKRKIAEEEKSMVTERTEVGSKEESNEDLETNATRLYMDRDVSQPMTKKEDDSNDVKASPAESVHAIRNVKEIPNEQLETKKRSAYGLIHRKDLQELKNDTLSAKKRKTMKMDDGDFDEKDDSRDLKAEIEAAPEDKAVWLPPQGQDGSGRTKLNDKFAGIY